MIRTFCILVLLALAGTAAAQVGDASDRESVEGSGLDSVEGSGLDSVEGSGLDSVEGSGLNSDAGAPLESVEGSGRNAARGMESVEGTGLHSAAESFEATTSGARSHTVVANETLRSLALRYYGDAELYTRIFSANSATLSDANHLPVGAVLTIP